MDLHLIQNILRTENDLHLICVHSLKITCNRKMCSLIKNVVLIIAVTLLAVYQGKCGTLKICWKAYVHQLLKTFVFQLINNSEVL